jgi:nicotinate-nucleotide adenylyltransferase
MTGLFGGAFDPPHNAHVALVEAARNHFGLERLFVFVVVAPGHRAVTLDFASRFELASLAFADVPGTEVLPEEHGFTVDAVRDGRYGDAIFLVGADEFAGFLDWKEPNEVLEHVRLGVATRPGYDPERLEAVLARLERPDRVELFDIPPVPLSASEIRARLARGESARGFVPDVVADVIEARGLYR